NLRVQNIRNQNGLIGVPRNANQNGNDNLIAARAEGNATGHNADLDEIEEVNANCILMANLQQVTTSGTQTDKAPVYDSDGSAEVHNYEDCYENDIFNMFTQEEQYTELLEPILESHQVPHNNNNVISKVTSAEQSEETVEQHPANVEETRALYDSLYQNLAIEVEKVNTVNRKLKETNAKLTNKLARFKKQEKCFEISQENMTNLKDVIRRQVIKEGGAEEEHVEDDTAAHGDGAQEPSIPSPTPPTLPSQPPQDLPSTSQVQHTPPQSPQPHAQPQPQAPQQATDFPMSLLKEALDACAALTRRVEHLELKKVGISQRINTSDDTVMEDASNHGRIIDEIDKDDVVALMDDKEEDKKEEKAKVVEDDQEDEPAEVQEVVDVVTTAKLITGVVTTASETVTAACTTISAAEP
nr:hypothetical protein [Tanacetum cinerariifolium]